MCAQKGREVNLHKDLRLIYGAAFFRSLGIGLMGVVLGIFLAREGFPAFHIGLIVGSGLAGSAVGTLFTSLRADRLGRRKTLMMLSLLGALGGVGLAMSSSFVGMLLLAFCGMLNSMGSDRGAAFALEQAVIPQGIPAHRRTAALSWYNLVLDLGHALGALMGTLPAVLPLWSSFNLSQAYKLTFLIYSGCYLLSAIPYFFLSPEIEAKPTDKPLKLSTESKGIVTRLAMLSGLDSFGGGFLTDALFAYWFFRRFGVSEATLGPLFFAAHALNSISYLAAAKLARRIGLVNTMVFTHIPSSLFLIVVPFAPSFPWAAALFLARESLVEMDVPTRQSYIAAVVRPEERTLASGVTNLTRNVSWAVAPSVAGYLMQHLSLAAPLFLGGGAKILYDILLYAAFRRLKPEEEKSAGAVTCVSG